MGLIAQVKASGGPQGMIIISCCDPRLNPYEYLGLDETIRPVLVVRNAGGRAMDTERSVAALQHLGDARSVAIVQHTGEIHIVRSSFHR